MLQNKLVQQLNIPIYSVTFRRYPYPHYPYFLSISANVCTVANAERPKRAPCNLQEKRNITQITQIWLTADIIVRDMGLKK